MSIYLDNHATTRLDPRVLQVMMPYFGEQFGNPHSTNHEFGWQASEAVETARGQIADLLGARVRNIVFASGATEANNIAIIGAAKYRRQYDGRQHLVTLASEHPAVLQVMRHMQARGFDLDIIGVDGDGRVDLDALKRTIGPHTSLVSAMLVNNEIGVIQPMHDIAEICQTHDAWLHCDAAQAVGRVAIDLRDLPVQFLSLSSHKIYGPMGIGALVVASGFIDKLEPIIFGGGQEMGMRSGTIPLPLAVGLGHAAQLCKQQMDQDNALFATLSQQLLERLRAHIDDVRINGSVQHRVAANLHLTLGGIDQDQFFATMHGVALSAGSACAGGNSTSHVLQAIGVDFSQQSASFRVGFGRGLDENAVNDAATCIIDAWKQCKG